MFIELHRLNTHLSPYTKGERFAVNIHWILVVYPVKDNHCSIHSTGEDSWSVWESYAEIMDRINSMTKEK